MDLTLEGLGVDELLAVEMKKVIKNISDINTNPSATRKITVELTIIPKTDNQLAIQPVVKSKLAAIETVPVNYYYDRTGQLYLDDPEQLTIDNVSKIDKEA
jgi:hypothetical protein